jgi:glutamate synthase domain-containing protein 2
MAAIAVVGLLALRWPPVAWLYALLLPVIALGIYDSIQTVHAVRRNFPVVGNFRYLFEAIRPEINQYFVESNTDGMPFSREQRSVVYQRAKGVTDTLPFGTQRDVQVVGFEWINHSLSPKAPPPAAPRITIGGSDCGQPYAASLLNVSAMSFGSLSANAILALNEGARRGGFFHNTGEGGLSAYHLEKGGDLCWQIGTGYFGCRTPEGGFSPERFEEKARLPQIKMIEIKLSQGAKPGHGGILPAAKVTPEIAAIRGVPLGKSVISPAGHSAFDSPRGLLEFVRQLRALSGGKPVGFKLCLGDRTEFMAVCKAMVETGIMPDFITVDGAEGGTGAAPIEFSNSVGTPLNDGLVFIHNALIGIDLRDRVRIIAAGKITTGFNVVTKLALGADLCNSARGMMLALGCIQALRCNTNHCPTGVATQDAGLARGLVPGDKAVRVANFQHRTVESVLEILGAAGLSHPSQLRPGHIHRRTSATEVMALDKIYPYLRRGSLLDGTASEDYLQYWLEAQPDRFGDLAYVV